MISLVSFYEFDQESQSYSSALVYAFPSSLVEKSSKSLFRKKVERHRVSG